MRPMEQGEKEIELLLNEIPHLHHTHHNHRHDAHAHAHGFHDAMLAKTFHGFSDFQSSDPLSPVNAPKNLFLGHGHGYYSHGHACFSPSSFLSDGSSGSGSGSLSGTLSPCTDEFQPDLGFSVRDELSLLHRLQSVSLSNNRDNQYALTQYPVSHSVSYGYNSPVNYSVNDAFGLPHSQYSVLPDPHLFNSGGNLRDFEGLLCNNGGSVSRIPLQRESNQGFVPLQYTPYSISEALLQSQMTDYQSNYARNLNPNPINSNYGSTLTKSRYSTEPIEAFKCEESLIIQGNSLNYSSPKSRKNRGDSVNSLNLDTSQTSKFNKLRLSPLNYENLMGVKGYLYLMAKDQHGCRFLQQKFEEGKTQVDLVFEGVVDHALELMVNQFGNYLMQKLLEVCDEDQRLRFIVILTEDPAKLVKVSLNVHGTRVVQKLIETLGNKRQVNMVIAALKPGFLDLMKDLNGNHVVQQCLQSLKPDDNKFIFDAAAMHCVDIATHQHGCCVLQRCIACSSSENRAKLVAQVSSNGFLLAQDAFGNYVVQFVLDLKLPAANASLASQFEGKYIELSKQKFSSNVVEKCLRIFSENDKAKIVLELLSASRFDQLVQDPYANYVIHTALQTSKGSLHGALVEAIKPHAEVLRTNPHCKRIVSRSLLKK